MKIQHEISPLNAAKVTAAIMLTRIAIRLAVFATIAGAILTANHFLTK